MSIEGPKNDRTEIRGPESVEQREHVPAFEWHEHGFDFQMEIKERTGPFIEVAGPTPGGYEQLSENEYTDVYSKLITSNVFDGLYHSRRDPQTGAVEGEKIAPVHFAADAKQLPLRDGTVGALFCSYLNPDQRNAFLMKPLAVLRRAAYSSCRDLRKWISRRRNQEDSRSYHTGGSCRRP